MALSDPLSINYGAGALNHARVSTGPGRSAVYFADEGDNETRNVTVSHTVGKRQRSVFRIDHQQVVDDFFDDNRNNLLSQSLYLVLDRPVAGIDVADSSGLYVGLTGVLEASSSAVLNKWLNGES
jgi:hypothetical protein